MALIVALMALIVALMALILALMALILALMALVGGEQGEQSRRQRHEPLLQPSSLDTTMICVQTRNFINASYIHVCTCVNVYANIDIVYIHTYIYICIYRIGWS